MKLKNGVEILSLERRLASVRLRAPLRTANITANEELITRLRGTGRASQFFNFANNQQKQDNFNFTRIDDVLPKDQDYILVQFRAISKTIVEGYFLDFTVGDVLKQSTPLLLGQTVYPNHDFCDVNNWLGSVSNVAWDEAGTAAGGVPGINAEYKIDALMNPRIARGLLMDPPAIHSTSMTVLFEFEFSHPDLVEQGRFWQLLGEEVEGSIVRLIVTKVTEYWEASLVFQGADRLAKQIDDAEDDSEEDFADMSALGGTEESRHGCPNRQTTSAGSPDAAGGPTTPPNSNQEKTMKLTAEQKAELGIEFDGEEVPETEIHAAATRLAARLKPFDEFDPANIAVLQAKAAAGEKFVERLRSEVTRKAKLAELGADAGDLEEVVASAIADADFDRLEKLDAYYEKKVAERFPKTARSSQEDSAAVENAGGVSAQETAELPRIGVL